VPGVIIIGALLFESFLDHRYWNRGVEIIIIGVILRSSLEPFGVTVTGAIVTEIILLG
ncbi:22026_t:CDS:1, partial [Racocetra persica]